MMGVHQCFPSRRFAPQTVAEVLLMDMPSWAVQLQKLVIPIRRQTIQISNELELLKPDLVKKNTFNIYSYFFG